MIVECQHDKCTVIVASARRNDRSISKVYRGVHWSNLNTIILHDLQQTLYRLFRSNSTLNCLWARDYTKAFEHCPFSSLRLGTTGNRFHSLAVVVVVVVAVKVDHQMVERREWFGDFFSLPHIKRTSRTVVRVDFIEQKRTVSPPICFLFWLARRLNITNRPLALCRVLCTGRLHRRLTSWSWEGFVKAPPGHWCTASPCVESLNRANAINPQVSGRQECWSSPVENIIHPRAVRWSDVLRVRGLPQVKH